MIKSLLKRHWPLLLAVLTLTGLAVAQNTITANQGKPGSYGAWPVSFSSATPAYTTNAVCSSPTHKVTSVGVAAGNTPSSQLATRRFITLCVSTEETTNITVKCRADGTNPVIGETNPGDVLKVGDCVRYDIPASVVPLCISDTATTAVTSFECI